MRTQRQSYGGNSSCLQSTDARLRNDYVDIKADELPYDTVT